MTALRPVGLRDGYWSELRVRAMGSEAHVIAGDCPPGVLDWAERELERLEQCWSRFRDDSELSALNRHHGDWVHVGDSLLLALTCAADLHRVTTGRFDPTIIDALERSGYDRTFDALTKRDDAAECVAPVAAPGFAEVEIDEAAARVRLPRGTRIDLGGVGKGLAADLVARGLVDRGARTALVGMGGDLRARGEPPPPGWWDVPVQDPFDESRVVFDFPLTTGAIVTSTTRIRTWSRAGRMCHHLIDPATGEPATTGISAVIAAAPEAWWAEGIAKSILIGGIDAAGRLAERAKVRAWLVLDDRNLVEIGPGQ